MFAHVASGLLAMIEPCLETTVQGRCQHRVTCSGALYRALTTLDGYIGWFPSICMDKREAGQALQVHCIFDKCLLQSQTIQLKSNHVPHLAPVACDGIVLKTRRRKTTKLAVIT